MVPGDAEKFVSAVERRDASALRTVLSESAEARDAINQPLFGFDSPALVAVAGDGNLQLVDTLLDFGADPNRKSDWWAGGFHPLHGAEGAVADRLLAAGAIPDACAAARLNRVDLLTTMFDMDPSRVHERGGDGQTPLHFACSREVIDMLLFRGADIDARDLDHRSTPAEWMVGDVHGPRARVTLARYLVDRGASCDIFLAAALGLSERARDILESDPSVLSWRTGQGRYAENAPGSFHIYQWTLGATLSPLQVAAGRGMKDTLRVMEEYASLSERLIAACHAGDREKAMVIVDEHPRVMDTLTPTQRHAVADEAWRANGPAVALLLELGFDPAQPGHMRASALHLASWQGSVESVSAILSDPGGRALIDVREASHQGTPLSWCCHGSRNCGSPKADHGAVARLLISAGSKVTDEMLAWDCSAEVQGVVEDALK